MSVTVWSSPLARDCCSRLRRESNITPRHEFVDPRDHVICDLGGDSIEPGLKFYAVELGGFDQCIGYRGGPGAASRPHKPVIFPPERASKK
ncbi:MAG: hypothetical protein AAF922_12610 [Pseudomonadota bacterium]